MGKNDKLKEELAESRHVETITLALGALGIAGVSLGVAYGVWKGWLLSTIMMLIIIAGWLSLYYLARRNSQKRRDKMKQLDNEEQNPMPECSAKELTNQDIVNKLHEIQNEFNRAELRDRVLAWLGFISVGASFALASVLAYQWRNVMIGVIFVIIGIVLLCLRVRPRW